jgi:hypothetical protein
MTRRTIFTAASILSEIIAAGVASDTVAKPSLGTFKGERVLLGVGSSKKLYLMIPVSHSYESDQDETLTPTLSIKVIDQRDDNNKIKKFLTLHTSSEFDVSLFGALCDEAINGLGNVEDARELLKSIVSHWRMLLDSISENSFGKSKAIGLFGELVFLKLFQSKCGDEALNAWIGPEGGRHDFLFETAAAEIKSTTRTDSLVAEVHGIDQFDEVPGKKRWLGFAQLEWDPNGTSLSDLIKTSRDLFEDKSKFDEKLALIGITDATALNPGFKFSQRQLYLNEVDSSFPFIMKKEIETLIDVGRLRGFGYAVNLDGLCTQLDDKSIFLVVSKANS